MVTKSFYRGSDAGILVYDITKEESFESIKRWLDDIHEFAPKNIRLILVGNKRDLEKE